MIIATFKQSVQIDITRSVDDIDMYVGNPLKRLGDGRARRLRGTAMPQLALFYWAGCGS